MKLSGGFRKRFRASMRLQVLIVIVIVALNVFWEWNVISWILLGLLLSDVVAIFFDWRRCVALLSDEVIGIKESSLRVDEKGGDVFPGAEPEVGMDVEGFETVRSEGDSFRKKMIRISERLEIAIISSEELVQNVAKSKILEDLSVDPSRFLVRLRSFLELEATNFPGFEEEIKNSKPDSIEFFSDGDPMVAEVILDSDCDARIWSCIWDGVEFSKLGYDGRV